MRKVINFFKAYWHWIALFMFGLIYLLLEVPYRQSMKVTSQTVATVYEVTFKSVYFEYSVADRKYNGHERKVGIISDYVRPGDGFMLTYSSKIPGNYQIQFHQPVIFAPAQFKATETVDVDFFGSGSFVRFWYEVEGVRFERIQCLNKISKEPDKQRYRVIYNEAHPDEGFIEIDSANRWVIAPGIKQ